MKSFCLELKLLDDVVVSAHAASVSQHRCLNTLPGSVFLGVAARRFYSRWDREQPSWSWLAFHSGRVRFGQALPVLPDSDATTLPVPLSWHMPKGESPADGGKPQRLRQRQLHNLAAKRWDFGKGQPQQVREGWFSPADGLFYTVEHRFRLRTSIDREAGFDRAKDEQLFGFSSLPRGSRFRAWIETDVEAHPELDALHEALQEFFLSVGEILVGRSRRAEYGAASVKVTEGVPLTVGPVGTQTDGRLFRFHALSDLALLDHLGQPTLRPAPEHFGLHTQGCTLAPEQTFLRSRSYAPFNQFRNAPDLERQVLVRGSVITFRCPETVDPTAVHGVLPGRVGAYRQEGLGWVVCEPTYLSSPEPTFARPTLVMPTVGSAAGAGDAVNVVPMPVGLPAFARVMRQRYEGRQIALLAVELGRAWAQAWVMHRGGPRRSQWARVREAAGRAGANRQQLVTQLNDRQAGIFHRGVARRRWAADRYGVELSQAVTRKLNDDAAAGRLLREYGLRNEADLRDLLIVEACREAALLAGRQHSDREE